MLEVIGEDPCADEVLVIAGLGRRANWYRNTAAGGAVEIAVARERFTSAYERRHRLIAPVIRVVLGRLVGWPYDGTPDARRRLLGELPVIAFRPLAGRTHRVLSRFIVCRGDRIENMSSYCSHRRVSGVAATPWTTIETVTQVRVVQTIRLV